MKKLEVQRRVLQNGKPLELGKFEWDEKTNTFSSSESNLVLDFNTLGVCTFNTGWYCTFDTCGDCTFNTGGNCTFDTGWYCTFDTGGDCTFDTGGDCTFNTGGNCTFDTGWYCTFNTLGGCVIVRRDVYEVIETNKLNLTETQQLKLNGFNESGYTIIDSEPKLDDKTEEAMKLLKERGYRIVKD